MKIISFFTLATLLIAAPALHAQEDTSTGQTGQTGQSGETTTPMPVPAKPTTPRRPRPRLVPRQPQFYTDQTYQGVLGKETEFSAGLSDGNRAIVGRHIAFRLQWYTPGKPYSYTEIGTATTGEDGIAHIKAKIPADTLTRAKLIRVVVSFPGDLKPVSGVYYLARRRTVILEVSTPTEPGGGGDDSTSNGASSSE